MNASRWIWVGLCVGLAGLLLFCGGLIPVHLRAVEALVLERAGEGSVSLLARGLELGRSHNAEAARLILQAATEEKIDGTNELAAALAGDSDHRLSLPGGWVDTNSAPITEWVIRLENRERVLAFLQSNGLPAVRALLRTRDLTNTVLFPSSGSSSGQAFDAAVAVCGLLLAGNELSPGLRDVVMERAAAAQTQPDAQPLEEVLMDFMSLGQRMTWGELAAFVNKINDPVALTTLAELARKAGAQWPELYAAVVLSAKPEQVANWMTEFSQTGLDDLGAALRSGEGGLDELMQRHQRLASASTLQRWAASGPLASFARVLANCAIRTPWLALAAKWFCYLSAGFLLAATWHYARSVFAVREEPGRGRGISLARELLCALGFLLVLLPLSEPYLAQESQQAAPRFIYTSL